jgi:hypothetical protein
MNSLRGLRAEDAVVNQRKAVRPFHRGQGYFCSAGTVFIFTCLLAASCSLVDGGDDGKPKQTWERNPSLKELLYWGEVDPQNWAPNEGVRVGNLRNPTWVASDRILVVTGTVIHGNSVKGLFGVNIDPSSLQYTGYTAYEFAPWIWTLAYNRAVDQLAVLYYVEGSPPNAAFVSLEENQVVIQKQIVGQDWNPTGIDFWPSRDGVVIYGSHSTNGIGGFYWCRTDTASETRDSLLCAVPLSQSDARGFSINADGTRLYFGTTVYLEGQYNALILSLDLRTAGAEPVVLLQRKGGFIAVRCHPVDPNVLLVNFDSDEAHIELVETEPLVCLELNVETRETRVGVHNTNEYPSWSPDGRHFAFSASWYDSEGGGWPWSLWTYQDAR